MRQKTSLLKRRIFSFIGSLLAAGLAVGAFSSAPAKGRPAASEDPRWVPLFTVVGMERAGADAVAPQASRYRAVAINPLLAEEGGVSVGDKIFISAFGGEAALGTVDRVGTDVNGVVAVRARIQGSDGYLLLSSDKGRSLGRIVLPERREFEISCAEGGPSHIVQEFAPGARVALPGGEPLIPPSQTPRKSVLPPLVKAPAPAAVVTIDCMIVYTASARDYANGYTGINNYVSQAMSLAQLGMDNSLVEITMRLVYSGLVDYTESGSSNTDLSRLTNTSDGYMDEVHTLRNAYGADLVHLFTNVEDTGGLGWLLNTASGSPTYAFCLGRIKQVSWTTTTVHEWGHNMGAHHRIDQETQPGPGLFSYSAGWRWIGATDSKKYCSIMSYTDSWDGVTPTDVEYFSNPSVTYKGTATGHATNGDNARTLREIKSVIAAYRNTAITISGTIKVGTTALANVVLSGFADTVKTDASGAYAGSVTSGWTGSITPVLAGYTFSPTSRSYTNVTTSQTGQDYAATEVPAPRIALSKTTLAFGAVIGGGSTSAQSSVVSNSGVGTLNWTAASNKSWLGVTPASGTGTAVLRISVNAAGQAAGTYTGTITVSDPSASNTPQTVTVTLAVYSAGGSSAPSGYFDSPTDGAQSVRGAIPVTGWVVDDIETTKVEIWRDNIAGETPAGLWFIGTAIFVEGARTDIEQIYTNRPLNYKAGWGYLMLTNMLPGQGNGPFKLYAYATDKEGNSVLLGTKSITCDNANAVKPFGTIDTPAQGGDASGSLYVNFGWVLTPMPKTVAKDGTTITVWVDGTQLGNLSTWPNVYNRYRSDVSANFPGLNNTGGPAEGAGGPVGAFYLDTTKYQNGVHSIYWVATDNGGQTDGIGSRFFNIVNTGSTTKANAGGQAIQSGQADSYESIMNLPLSFSSKKVRRGFDLRAEPETIRPDNHGIIQVDIKELERIELDLGAAQAIHGYVLVANELRPLPIGSTVDPEKGTFAWMPGPGFLGTYTLIFTKGDEFGVAIRIPVTITIEPKYGKK